MSNIGALSQQIVTPVTGGKILYQINYEHQSQEAGWQKRPGRQKTSNIVSTLDMLYRSKARLSSLQNIFPASRPEYLHTAVPMQ